MEMKSYLRRLPYIYCLVLIPCSIYTVFFTARALRRDYIDVPAWDAWRCVHDLDRLCQFDLRPLWRQHNEHRVIGVQVLYWLDFGLLHGRQFLLIGCEIVCQLAQLVLLWWLLKQMKAIPLAFRLAFAASCALLMTTATHVQAMVIPFLVQWYLTQALAAFALLLLWRTSRTGRLASLIIAIVATVIVTYTTANGMLLWPVLVAMALWLRLPRRRIVAIGAACAVSVAVYFIGYVFVGEGRALLLVTHPFYTTGFMAILLGAPASYSSNAFGGALGLTGMVLAMLALVVAVRQRRRPPDAVFVVAAGFCLFIVSSALMFAYGRMNPADPTFLKARAERYAMVGLTFWANLVVVVGWLSTRLVRRRQFFWQFAAAALTAVLLVEVMGYQPTSERACAARQAMAEEAGIGLENGVQDREAIRDVYQDPLFVWAETPVLRRRRLSIFAAGRQDWIGRRVSELFAAGRSSLCSGSVEALTAVYYGFRAEGRAVDSQTNRPPDDIVFTNRSGMIVGLGATRTGGYPHRPRDRTQRPPADFDWAGFARAGHVSGGVQAYAIVGGGKAACPLGTPQQAPVVFIPVDANMVGDPIPISGWQADPAWTRNGHHPSVGTLAGEVLYGSYSGSDAKQGGLTSAPFETGRRDCVAIPVAHGPSTTGQSVRLVEDGSGKTAATIPLDGDGVWQYWLIELQGPAKLRIVAEDRGAQWGQWVAVGEPRECRP
jgi:hypothetical protein